MLGGGLYRGGGLAGELGHLVVRSDENVPVCERCGNRGCLETVAGWDAVLRSLGRPATQRDLEEALYLAAYPGNIERDAFESAASEVGRALGQLVTLLNPDIVIIGGDVGKSGFDVIRGPLLMSMRRHTIQPALADLTVLPPALQQNAALHGAIGLILRGDGSSSTLASYFQRSTADIRG
jgi:predicted NBD/HSP70 family sugar kinase